MVCCFEFHVDALYGRSGICEGTRSRSGGQQTLHQRRGHNTLAASSASRPRHGYEVEGPPRAGESQHQRQVFRSHSSGRRSEDLPGSAVRLHYGSGSRDHRHGCFSNRCCWRVTTALELTAGRAVVRPAIRSGFSTGADTAGSTATTATATAAAAATAASAAATTATDGADALWTNSESPRAATSTGDASATSEFTFPAGWTSSWSSPWSSPDSDP